MLISDTIRAVVANDDARGAVRVAEYLRSRGARYDDIAGMGETLTGMDRAEWDARLREGEAADADGST